MATYGVYPDNNVETIAKPDFIDTASCRCAWRPIAEQGVTDLQDTQAWRCVVNATQNIHGGLSGKWFFPLSKERYVGGVGEEEEDTGYPPPDRDNWFTARLDNDRSVRVRFFDTFLSHPDTRCTGIARAQERETTPGSTHPFLIQRQTTPSSNGAPTSTSQPSTCVGGPRAIGVPMQNASSWQTTGCLAGFLCELILHSISRRKLILSLERSE